MIGRISILAATLFCLNAQRTLEAQRLVAAYHFENCSLRSVNPLAADMTAQSALNCSCGLDNEDVILDGQRLQLPASLDSFFRNDYSICFSVLLSPFSGEMDLISKASGCNSDTSLRITYRTRDSSFLINVKRGLDRNLFLNAKSDPSSCWQSVCLTKTGLDFRLYVNGILLDRKVAPNVINLDSGVPVSINGSPCQSTGLLPASGRIDRVLLANFGLDARTVDSLYLPQHKILTQDTIIFLGDRFNLRTANNCPTTTVSWTPAAGLSSTSSFSPEASPVVETRYIARFTGTGCVNTDTVLVRVVDKDLVECRNLRFPTAFTPNQDGLNEEFGISNPYLIEKLNHFTILDRNGGILFQTTDPQMTWDGTFKNSALATGTYYYRVSYQCRGEDYNLKGSFVLLR